MLEECLNRLLNDGQDLHCDILVSRQNGCARASITLHAKDNTVLAGKLTSLGSMSSEFASVYDDHAVLLAFVRFQLADSVRRILQTFDPSVNQFLELKDEQRRSAADQVKDLAEVGTIVLRTTLELGHIDVASSYTADSSGNLTTLWVCFAGGARHLERPLRELVQNLTVRGQGGSLSVDVSRYEKANIHRTGDDSYIAIGDSLIAVAKGPEAHQQLTHLLEKPQRDGPFPPVLIRGKANAVREPLRWADARLKNAVPLSQIVTGEGMFTLRIDAVPQGAQFSVEFDQQLLHECAANTISTFVHGKGPK